MTTDAKIIDELTVVLEDDRGNYGPITRRDMARQILAALKSGAIPIPDDAPGMVEMRKYASDCIEEGAKARKERDSAYNDFRVLGYERDQLRADLVVAIKARDDLQFQGAESATLAELTAEQASNRVLRTEANHLRCDLADMTNAATKERDEANGIRCDLADMVNANAALAERLAGVERERDESVQYRSGHLPSCNGIDEAEHRCACGYLQGEAYRDLAEELRGVKEHLESERESHQLTKDARRLVEQKANLLREKLNAVEAERDAALGLLKECAPTFHNDLGRRIRAFLAGTGEA